MEKTLILIKPNAIQRGIMGDIITRFERKGLRFAGMKMLFMTDELVAEHYAHLVERPFFPYLKASMQAAPLIACCLEGAEAVETVRLMVGVTNSRKALPCNLLINDCAFVGRRHLRRISLQIPTHFFLLDGHFCFTFCQFFIGNVG